VSALHELLCPNSDECERWDADMLSPEDVERLHGEAAAKEYMNWIYLNLK